MMLQHISKWACFQNACFRVMLNGSFFVLKKGASINGSVVYLIQLWTNEGHWNWCVKWVKGIPFVERRKNVFHLHCGSANCLLLYCISRINLMNFRKFINIISYLGLIICGVRQKRINSTCDNYWCIVFLDVFMFDAILMWQVSANFIKWLRCKWMLANSDKMVFSQLTVNRAK